MILYLQKDANGTYAVVEKNNHKDEVMNFDYITIIDNLPKRTRYASLVNWLVREYNCKKLIIDF